MDILRVTLHKGGTDFKIEGSRDYVIQAIQEIADKLPANQGPQTTGTKDLGNE